jgi:hypothetical protein
VVLVSLCRLIVVGLPGYVAGLCSAVLVAS